MANTPGNEPDIRLLFGVEGGASIDQGSGKQIFDDLKSIVSNINGKDVLKIKVGLDDGAAKEFKEQIKGIMSGSDTGVEVKIKGLDQTSTDAGKAAKALDDVASSAKKAGQAAKVASVADNNSIKDKKATLKEVINLYNQIGKYIKKNSRAEGAEEFEKLRNIYAKLGEELDGVDAASLKAEHGLSKISKVDIKVAATEVAHLQRKLHEAGKDGMTFAEVLTAAYEKFGGWMLVTQSLTKVINGLKKMVENVAQLDAAMTELKKVTNETDAVYNRFLDNASVRARQLGASLTDVVNATADFSRLGHGIEDASMLADAALVYKNVGDGIEDISEASANIISTMQAFGIEANEVMSIVDKFNNVGNRHAISSKGIGDALLNSASAMKAAGNTLDETIALITAAI